MKSAYSLTIFRRFATNMRDTQMHSNQLHNLVYELEGKMPPLRGNYMHAKAANEHGNRRATRDEQDKNLQYHKDRFDALDSEIEKTKMERAAAAEYASAARANYDAIVDLVSSAGLSFFHEDPLQASSSKPVKNPKDAVERIRVRIDELRADQKDVRFPPLPKEEAIARLDKHIEARVGAFESSVPALTDARCEIHELLAMPARMNVATASVMVTTGALYWLFGDRLRERAIDELELLYENLKPGLPLAARAGKILEIERDIFGLEIEEENAILAAGAAGIPILRRKDADPAVLLQIAEAPEDLRPDWKRHQPSGSMDHAPRGVRLHMGVPEFAGGHKPFDAGRVR